MQELNSVEMQDVNGGANSPVPSMLDIIKAWLHIK